MGDAVFIIGGLTAAGHAVRIEVIDGISYVVNGQPVTLTEAVKARAKLVGQVTETWPISEARASPPVPPSSPG